MMAEMRNCTPYAAFVFFFLFYLLVIDLCCQCRGENPDDTTMYELTQSLYGVPSNWKPQLDPFTWDDVICSRGRVIAINLAQSGISGITSTWKSYLSHVSSTGVQQHLRPTTSPQQTLLAPEDIPPSQCL
ncbi:hypothetical protein ZIOFF_046875 [Zingiber officinale]|uniref:Leucine-rich repeat-containing N-terminal plant-type domain-containing protein n=1 Tax=Zingiber officinale TaxID=94328 RepID=A0A8J5FQN0_ZINOF|nr:hypothetical protein ZIOFF_046875 [Zingiber officinale]